MKTKNNLLAVGMLLTAAINGFGQTGSIVQFSSGYYGAFENSGSATVTVTRYTGTNAFSVDYATSDGTAVAGVDYTAQSGTLSFGVGEMEKTFTVSVLDDNLTEGVETVKLTLKNPTGQVTLGQPSEAILWIVDDEPGATLLDPTFAPRVTSISTYDGTEYAGYVSSIGVQADGKILIGGDFSKVNGVNRGHIARLNADGSLDMSFDAGSGPTNTSACQSYGSVSALTVTDGAIYAGGQFNSFSGVSRTGIARLNPDGSLDGSFKPTLGPTNGCEVHVSSIVMQADGKLLISGTSVNGISRSGIARLNSDGTLDTTFNSPLDFYASVNALALQKDGRVLVGLVSHVYPEPQEYRSLFRLNGNGSVDGGFNPIFAEGSSRVNSLVVQEDGKAIVGGYFGFVNGISRSGIVRLNPDGSVDASFDPGTGAANEFELGEVRSVAVQSDGKILLCGDFRYVNGLRRDGIARLHPDGSVDSSFYAGIGSEVYISAMVLQSDGKVLLAEDANWNGIESSGIFRLNRGLTIRSLAFTSPNYVAGENDGTANVTVERIGDSSGTIAVDYSTSPGTASAGSDYVEQSGTLSFAPREALKTIMIPLLDDGLVENDKTANLTLGNPTGGALLGSQRTAVLRILDNERPGSLDPSFNPPVGIRPGEREILSVPISSLVVQPDGKVWVSGASYFLGVGIVLLGRLNPDGSLDSSFIPGYGARFIGLQSASRAIIFGYSETLGNSALQRVNADGSIDTNYQETAFPYYSRLSAVVQPNDKVIVADYTITRFNADGGVDGSFKAGQLDGNASLMALQPDGKLLLSGGFSMVNGVSRQGMARLLPNGDLDSGFNPSLATSASIRSLVVQPDGKVIIGGNFSTQGVLPRTNLVRLNADGSLDSSFAPADVATNPITALALQTDGKLIVAGYLTFADGIGFLGPILSRLNTDGSIDQSFDPGTGPNGDVYRMAWQGDGKLLIAGGFTEVNGVRRLRIARLNGDPPFKFGPLARTANGPLRLSLTAQPGKNYVLQASTNLMDWLSLSTNTPAGFNLEFEDAGAANFPRRFYRARQLAP